MKNKQKLWRRMAQKSRNDSGDLVRNGRALRQLTTGFNINAVRTTPILTALFERAGIIATKPIEVQQTEESVNETN